MNGIDTQIIMKPLKFNDFGDENDNATQTNKTTSDDNISTGNIEEKQDGNNNKENEE